MNRRPPSPNAFPYPALFRSTDVGGCGAGSTLNLTTGTLTNSPSGTISTLVGNGGGRALNAQIDNQGTISVAQSLSIDNPSRTFTSTAGTLNVASGRTVTISNGTTVLGAGTILLGSAV